MSIHLFKQSGGASGAASQQIVVPISDETTALTTGIKFVWHPHFAFTLTAAALSLSAQSTAGVVEVDVKKNGTSMFTTNLTVDANEDTSNTAAVPVVLDSAQVAVAAFDRLEFEIIQAGTEAMGAEVGLTAQT